MLCSNHSSSLQNPRNKARTFHFFHTNGFPSNPSLLQAIYHYSLVQQQRLSSFCLSPLRFLNESKHNASVCVDSIFNQRSPASNVHKRWSDCLFEQTSYTVQQPLTPYDDYADSYAKKYFWGARHVRRHTKFCQISLGNKALILRSCE